ncbi:MAG: MotA/TolQ/ExbB proton channel family protein [Bacteroidales bacterium]|nr:MotA/TolQ/ExbB proton channel family protein [Bacteroidales bacterium]MCF0173626.1 MotA/TolQ/ExbB proton channel family protein [Bacteroidales bacterium]
MKTINEILFTISNGLMIPVVILLLALIVIAIITLFNFFADYSAHIKWLKEMEHSYSEYVKGDIAGMLAKVPSKGCPEFTSCFDKLIDTKGDKAACDMIVASYEIVVDKKLAKSRLLLKLGPMLGLMGTLIPMGPALVGLAAGDISSMAINMQVAFSTTVVGMLIAAIGLISLSADKRFYAHTLNDLQFISEILQKNETEK